MELSIICSKLQIVPTLMSSYQSVGLNQRRNFIHSMKGKLSFQFKLVSSDLKKWNVGMLLIFLIKWYLRPVFLFFMDILNRFHVDSNSDCQSGRQTCWPLDHGCEDAFFSCSPDTKLLPLGGANRVVRHFEQIGLTRSWMRPVSKIFHSKILFKFVTKSF